ncbi:Flp pilus assembly protein CpaB [bacterium]|nr:Flp pilus assembly protein CpaB [bacterium]
MDNRALTLSLVMAGIAIYFMYSYVSSIEDAARKEYGTKVLVLKAKRDIKEQESIDETMFELEVIPKRFREPASIYFEKSEADKETTKSLKELSGLVAVVPIKKGEQLTHNKLTEPSIRTGLAPQVAPGRRAISIPVSEVTGVSKLVKPGDRVDVIAILDIGGGRENKVAKTILQDVVVLSVGRYVSNNVARVVDVDSITGREKVRPLSEDASFSSVSLEVEPVQAQALALVMANGDNAVSLSLRNNDDTDRVGLGAMNLGDVLGPDAARIRAPANGGARR